MTIPDRFKKVPSELRIAPQTPLMRVGRNTYIISTHGAHVNLEAHLPAFIKSGEEQRTVLNNGYKFKLIKQGEFIVAIPLLFFSEEKPTRRLDILKKQKGSPYYGVVFPINDEDQATLEEHNLNRNISVLAANANPRAIGTFVLHNYPDEIKIATQTHIRVTQATKQKTQLKTIAHKYTNTHDWRTVALREIRKMSKKAIQITAYPLYAGHNPNQLNCAAEIAREEGLPLPLNGYSKSNEMGVRLPPKE